MPAVLGGGTMAAWAGGCRSSDDHPDFRAGARALLEADGFDVVGEAADGESALEATRRLRPRVVLLDIQLPGMDGFHVAERLAAGADPAAAVPNRSAARRCPNGRAIWPRDWRSSSAVPCRGSDAPAPVPAR